MPVGIGMGLGRRLGSGNLAPTPIPTRGPVNPMTLVGRPKTAKMLPKGLLQLQCKLCWAATESETERRASDWVERDRFDAANRD